MFRRLQEAEEGDTNSYGRQEFFRRLLEVSWVSLFEGRPKGAFYTLRIPKIPFWGTRARFPRKILIALEGHVAAINF